MDVLDLSEQHGSLCLKKIIEKIDEAEKADAYFITVTFRQGDILHHFQSHSFNFYFKDLLPSIEEVKKLILKEYPGMKYVKGISDHTGQM